MFAQEPPPDFDIDEPGEPTADYGLVPIPPELVTSFAAGLRITRSKPTGFCSAREATSDPRNRIGTVVSSTGVKGTGASRPQLPQDDL